MREESEGFGSRVDAGWVILVEWWRENIYWQTNSTNYKGPSPSGPKNPIHKWNKTMKTRNKTYQTYPTYQNVKDFDYPWYDHLCVWS